ncbi:hypothetical protein GWI33_005097 [Rhynchophorus ferrugineus]|uniref:Uncharacterized protein n=1 Tax=Rhynchophorus ferrugineus TaxID=354439 RepID=A0A834MNZ4_RHYFE|nr:hypothetical protein GWI33_005097 [Rhynchophorus ferrugineus]
MKLTLLTLLGRGIRTKWDILEHEYNEDNASQINGIVGLRRYLLGIIKCDPLSGVVAVAGSFFHSSTTSRNREVGLAERQAPGLFRGLDGTIRPYTGLGLLGFLSRGCARFHSRIILISNHSPLFA